MPPTSQAIFKKLVNCLPQAVLMFRKTSQEQPGFECMYSNQLARTMLGRDEQDLEGKALNEFFQLSSADLLAIEQTFLEVLASQKDSQLEVSVLPDGSAGKILRETTCVFVENEVVALLFDNQMVVADSAKSRAPQTTEENSGPPPFSPSNDQLELERALTFQKRMMATSPDIIHVHDIIDDQVIFANNTVFEEMGYTAEEVLEMGENVINILVHPDDIERVLQHNFVVLPGLADNEIARLEMRVLHKETREPIWFGATESVFSRDEDGRVRSTIGITRNINSQKKVETELILANQELEQFVYSVSHDLRTPVRHIASFTKIIQNREGSTLSVTGQNQLEEVLSAAKRLGSMIDELLAYSRTRNAKLEKVKIDSNELVLDILEASRQSNPQQIISWELPEIPTCMADPRMLRQIWENLISNAIKYSSKKEKTEIRIRGEQKSDEILFSIDDNGVGFDQKYADQLFSIFKRLHDSSDFPGHGIGLANVARMLEQHDGKIWGEGVPGEGARFYFTLPVG